MTTLKSLIILLLSFFSIEAFAVCSVKKDKFKIQIDSINVLVAKYDTISPFNCSYELITSLQNQITEKLLTVLNDKRILNYKIEELFIQNGGLFISQSDDNRIFFFSIDEKTGGTYRTSITVFHYRLKNGTVKAEIFDHDHAEAITTSTFGSIAAVDRDSVNAIYFLTGGVTTCATCIAELAVTLQLDSIGYSITTIKQVDCRSGNLTAFDYDTETKTFIYDYFLDPSDSLYGNENENISPNFRHRYKGKFQYINEAFIEMENCKLTE